MNAAHLLAVQELLELLCGRHLWDDFWWLGSLGYYVGLLRRDGKSGVRREKSQHVVSAG